MRNKSYMVFDVDTQTSEYMTMSQLHAEFFPSVFGMQCKTSWRAMQKLKAGGEISLSPLPDAPPRYYASKCLGF